MIYREVKKDIFTMENKYYLAHCISQDCALGAGIAVEFEKRFNLRQKLIRLNFQFPTCIKIDKVLNFVTKEKCWHKPTYQAINDALWEMRYLVEAEGIKHIAMPKIGCGLDRLLWSEVKNIINNIFNAVDVEIVVCYL